MQAQQGHGGSLEDRVAPAEMVSMVEAVEAAEAAQVKATPFVVGAELVPAVEEAAVGDRAAPAARADGAAAPLMVSI